MPPIEHHDMEGYPKEALTPSGWRATRKEWCAWNERFLLAAQEYGQIYPHLAIPNLLCRNVGIERMPGEMGQVPVGDGVSTYASYDSAVLTLDYDVQKEEHPPTELFEEHMETNAEFLTLPHQSLVWEFDYDTRTEVPLKVDEAPGYLIRGCDYSITIFNVRWLSAAVFNLIGFVNHQPYSSWLLGWTFPTETLRYDGPTLQRTTDTEGIGAWTLVMKFSYKPQFCADVPGAPGAGQIYGWNHFYRAATGKFERQWRGVAPNKEIHYQYPLGDFNDLQFAAVVP